MHRVSSIPLIIPWLIAIGVLVWLFSIRFPVSGTVTYTFPLDQPRGEFDQFLPTQRVTPIGVVWGNWKGQQIFDEPVYASARSPGVYDRVEILFEVNTSQPQIALGLMRDPTTWGIELHPVLDAQVRPEQTPDGWLKLRTVFDLPYPQDELKFVISAPGIKQRNAIIDVRRVEIRYFRPPLSLKEWVRVMKRELFLIRQRI